MLDEQHRGPAVALDVPERADEVAGLGVVESGRRLVEQEQARLGHQGASELDQAGPSEAERLDGAVGDVGEAEQLQGRVRASELVGGRTRAVEEVLPEAPGAQARPLGDQEVIADGHATEELDPLERAAEPETRPPVRRARA